MIEECVGERVLDIGVIGIEMKERVREDFDDGASGEVTG